MSAHDVNKLVNNTAWVYVGKLVAQLVGVVASILVIKKLPVDVFGTYTLILSIYTLLRLVLVSPLRDVIMRFFPEFQVEKNVAGIYRLSRAIFGLSICITLVFIGLVYLFQGLVSEWFKIQSFSDYFLAFAIFAMAFSIKLVIEAMLNALLYQKYTSLFNIGVVVIRAVLYIAFLSILDIELLLIIEAIVLFLFVALGVVFYRKHRRNIELSGPDNKVHRKRILRFGALSAMNELGAGVIGSTFDFFIISAFANTYMVGLYSFAINVIELFYRAIPIREFQSVLNPIFIKNYSGNQSSQQSLDRFYNIMVKFLVPVFILPLSFFIIFGKGVINLIYDPKYIDSYIIVCIILVGNLLETFFLPLTMIIKLKERVEINLYSKVMVLFSIVAGIMGIKHFGIIGVAVASVFGSLFKNLFMLWLSRKYFKINFDTVMFLNYFLIIILTILPFVFFQHWFDEIIGFTIGIILFVPFAAVVCIVLMPFNANERQLLHAQANHSKKLLIVYKVIEYIAVKKFAIRTLFQSAPVK